MMQKYLIVVRRMDAILCKIKEFLSHDAFGKGGEYFNR